MTVKLTFLGAAGTVTGSKYLLETKNRRYLIDCGLFQGYKQLRLRNWSPLPVKPNSIDAVLLTHAHLDHSGYLPLLVKSGFAHKIYCTSATRDLCAIMLPDSGHLQEQDAAFANRHGFSKHHPALPLYTLADAEASLKRFVSQPFHKPLKLAPDIEATFLYAGHILGAAMISLNVEGKTILFSGDLGRPNDPTMFAPDAPGAMDYLVLESTYGDRAHDTHDPAELLAEAITHTAARGGTVLIPAFTVGRTQNVLVYLHRLKQERRIPDLPVFLDSPMAIDASEIFRAHPKDHKMSPEETREAFATARYVHTPEESKALASIAMPKIIISASGMATGGRVLHHLKNYAPDHKNLILFTGFQAGGTRGAAMVAGAKTVKLHGQYIPIAADVRNLDVLSAHADAGEIMTWLRGFKRAPVQTFITHGEPNASDALRHRISEELGWTCHVPDYREDVDLT